MRLKESIGSLLTFGVSLELQVDEGLMVRHADFFFWAGTIQSGNEAADEQDEVEGHRSPKNLDGSDIAFDVIRKRLWRSIGEEGMVEVIEEVFRNTRLARKRNKTGAHLMERAKEG